MRGPGGVAKANLSGRLEQGYQLSGGWPRRNRSISEEMDAPAEAPRTDTKLVHSNLP